MYISVIIPTYNRRESLILCLRSIKEQTRIPDEVLIIDAGSDCISQKEIDGLNLPIRHYRSTPGLTFQRNLGLKAINAASEIVFFFDDDVVLNSDYIGKITNYYLNDETIGGIDGFPLIDGKRTYKIKTDPVAQSVKSLYGCNMSYRTRAIKDQSFDENLVKYSYLEDLDFSLRISSKFRLLRANDAICYHFCSPKSRIGEKQFGYMQIANCYYLMKKNKIPWSVIVKAILAPLKNIIRFYMPRYRNRLFGNLLAVKNIFIYYNRPEMLVKKNFD